MTSELGIIIPTQHESHIIKPSSSHAVLISGMGKVNSMIAASKLIASGFDKILLYGFCGGLRGLEPGDIVEPSEYIEGDFHAELLGHQYPNTIINEVHAPINYRRVSMVTQDRFLSEDIYERTIMTPVLACDMEAYAVAKLCLENSVTLYCVRVVSDCADTEAIGNFIKPSDSVLDKLSSTFKELTSCLTK